MRQDFKTAPKKFKGIQSQFKKNLQKNWHSATALYCYGFDNKKIRFLKIYKISCAKF